MARAALSGESFEGVEVVIQNPGGMRWVARLNVALRDVGGTVAGAITCFQDVTREHDMRLAVIRRTVCPPIGAKVDYANTARLLKSLLECSSMWGQCWKPRGVKVRRLFTIEAPEPRPRLQSAGRRSPAHTGGIPVSRLIKTAGGIQLGIGDWPAALRDLTEPASEMKEVEKETAGLGAGGSCKPDYCNRRIPF